MKRILVVDDERLVRQLIVDVLSSGNDVEAVGTVEEALERIDACEYDLIISDIAMPHAGGFHLYRVLCEKRPSLVRRLIFMTADPTGSEVRSFLGRTGSRCLSKPFSVRELIEACGSVPGPPSRGAREAETVPAAHREGGTAEGVGGGVRRRAFQPGGIRHHSRITGQGGRYT